MEDKRKLRLSLLIVVMILLLITGLTYAYFSANIEGEEETTTITISGGKLNITYDGGAKIIISNIIPSSEPFSIKTFTVTGNNTTDIEMYYDINLVVEENTFTEDAIKYKLQSDNTNNNGITIPSIDDLTNIGSGAKRIYLGAGSFDSPTDGDKVHTYNLELHFPSKNINQNVDQGKSFKAYVSITGAKEIPKDLHDLILAQDGGIDNINLKETPDFSKTAPEIISYKEFTYDSTEELASNNGKYVGTGYTFDKVNGRFDLTGHILIDDYNESHIDYYTCNSRNYRSCSTMYLIKNVVNNNITNSLKYQAAAEETDKSNTGIYAAPDDYGTSYYYRGAKNDLNNNLIWAGFQWKIVRINGDGSIKLIYNGLESDFKSKNKMNDIGRLTQLAQLNKWNLTYDDDAKYVGYMYGGANGVASTKRKGLDSSSATFNETSSHIKTVLETWYEENIFNKGLHHMVKDNIFCNDRDLLSEMGGESTGPGYGNSETTGYAVPYRLSALRTPSLKCAQINDQFTVLDTKGNGTLTYPIGLITGDEMALAGNVWAKPNIINYLYNDQFYMSMSPNSSRKEAYSDIVHINPSGAINNGIVTGDRGVRPTLSLINNVMVTGSGTLTNPYIVK